jgi:hypothetical protein
MSDLPAVIQEIGPALRRRLSWAETCTYAPLADRSPGELRRILGGVPVARDVEEMIDREGKTTVAPGRRDPSGRGGGFEETRSQEGIGTRPVEGGVSLRTPQADGRSSSGGTEQGSAVPPDGIGTVQDENRTSTESKGNTCPP